MYSSSNNVHQGHSPHFPNGHQPQQNGYHHNPQSVTSHRTTAQSTPRDTIRVLGVPSVTVSANQLIHGDSQSSSHRSYTPVKMVGDGSFGTVWLVDWHGALPPNTPLSPMQRGAGARPEWNGKRLVALKRMKKSWDGGWDECRKLKELESLRAIPFHPNIIPLYDFFLLPSTKELYFVFESMEGNLYQLIKSRKGKPLAGGLVSSIFRQVVSGLDHIHASGYFHRDMKPENLLVTTTGLFDYQPVSPIAPPGAPPEKDVVVIVKLADFGLARETKSKPPYTEYVSTRWYRAPEVLLRSRDYSNPVDMWALGTIMAELINLKPMFPGQGEIDQVAMICEMLGDPSDEYGCDARGVSIGGGKWVKGIKMARSVGFTFPKLKPVPIHTLFEPSVPRSIVECISDLLKYDPDSRLTSRQCRDHPYLTETAPRSTPPAPPHINTNGLLRPTNRLMTPAASVTSISPRSLPPSHAHSPQQAKPSFNEPPLVVPSMHNGIQMHRTPLYQQSVSSDSTPADPPKQMESTDILGSANGYDSSPDGNSCRLSQHSTVASSVYTQGGGDRISGGWTNSSSTDWEPMDVSSPQNEVPPQSPGQPMEIQTSPIAQEDPSRPAIHDEMPDHSAVQQHAQGVQSSGHKLKLGSLAFGKKHSKWGLGGMFGHGDKAPQNVLSPVDELNVASSGSTPSLKRTQSSSTDSRSLSELSPTGEQGGSSKPPMDSKMRKKEAERVAMEAEKVRRALAEKRSRDQARAVMQKRTQILKQNGQAADIDWESTHSAGLLGVQKSKAKQRQGAPPAASSSTVNAAGGRFRAASEGPTATESEHWRELEYRNKARRRDLDDDHSMSSSDVQSIGRLSVISFATVDSDPGPARIRQRPSVFGINRMQSTSSLRTSFGDDFPVSARSSNSLSLEQQLVNDFDSRASFSSYEAARSSLSETSSPPPMQMLSLSSAQQQPAMRQAHPSFITLPPPISSMHPQHLQTPGPTSPYEYGQGGHIQTHPPSPGIAPHSAINPMFKVPPPPISTVENGIPISPHTSLPPFSHIASVAEQYPPLSPMSFNIPEES